jgi:hypothetical protein
MGRGIRIWFGKLVYERHHALAVSLAGENSNKGWVQGKTQM